MITRLVLTCLVVGLIVLSGCKKTETTENQQPAPAPVAPADSVEPAPAPTGEVTPPPAQPEPADPGVPAGQLGMVAPAIEGVTWIKGGPVEMKPDTVYIVEFWATWCGPCRQSIPHLTDIQKKYADKKVVMVGISIDDKETENDVKPFVEKMGDSMDYAVAVDTQGKMNKNYMDAFGANGIPNAFIVDQKGKIVWQGHPMDGMEEVLEGILNGTFDAAAHAAKENEKLALEKQLRNWYETYFAAAETAKPQGEVRDMALKIVEKGHVEVLMSMAFRILVMEKKENRDLDIAALAAEQSNKLTEGMIPDILDVYAQILFENGQAPKAIEIEKKAIELCGDNEEAKKDLEANLAKFQGGTAQIGPQPTPATE